MAEFVERNLEGNFYGRGTHEIVFDGNNFEAKKREMNRKRTAREQGIPMSSVGHCNELMELQWKAGSNMVNNHHRLGRRTRGGGRVIRPKT